MVPIVCPWWPSGVLLGLCLVLGSVTPSVQAQDILRLLTLVNRNCSNFTIVGPCFCNQFTPCVRVSYWEPAWMVETVKIPGSTSLASTVPLLDQVLQLVGSAFPLGGGGAGNVPGSGQTNLHFNEAHVATFPLSGPCTGCQGSFAVHYVSEIDPLWRLAVGGGTLLDLFGLGRLGVWAPLYPRIGFSITGSAPVGSGIAAARALDIAFNPTGSPTSPEQRVVLQPTTGTSRCCQLALPTQTDCFRVGANPATWETGTGSPDGTYLWLFWRRQTCCIDPAQLACGFLLLGGAGANRCLE
jgi:hypothetical protein